MKKDKFYLIISILFVTILVVLVKGFNGTFSAPTGDIGGSGNLYWAIDGENCATSGSSCTLKISNNSIDGTHYVYGKLDGENEYALSAIPWSNYKEGITSIIIGGEGDIIKPISMRSWFASIKSATIDFTYLDTSDTTNMDYMFCNFGSGYTGDVVIDLSNLDLSSVKTMSHMFDETGNFSNSLTINLSGTDLSSLENVSYMFYEVGYSSSSHSSNIYINLSNITTSNLKSTKLMFEGAGFETENITIDMTNFNTSNVTDMSYMFRQVGLKASDVEIDLSGWNLKNVTNISNIFYMAFEEAGSFKINLSNWILSDELDITKIFYYMASESGSFELIMQNVDASNKKSLSSFFNGTYKGTGDFTLDITGWDTSNVEDMSYMFFNAAGYSKNVNIIGLDTWNTKNVTDMSYMFDSSFKSCTNDIEIDLSGWNLSKVTNMSHMFDETARASKSITVDLSELDLSSIEDMSYMFNGAGHNATTFELDLSNITAPNLRTTARMFKNMGGNSQNISINMTNFDTSSVEDMSYMFENIGYNSKNANVELIGLNTWDTSNVIYMTYMFYFAFSSNKNDIEIDLSGWNLKNVTDMSMIFYNAFEEAGSFKINLSDWVLPANATKDKMFKNLGFNSETFELIMQNVDASNTKDLSNYFEILMEMDNWNFASAKKIILDVTNWNTIGVENMSNMFSIWSPHTEEMKIVGLDTWDVSTVKNMSGMFEELGCNGKLSTLNLSGWDTSNVEDMSYMFKNVQYIDSFPIGIENFNTENVTNMSHMFSNYRINNEEKKNLDLSKWNTSKVTDMSFMFEDIGTYETSLDLSNWDTSNVENYEYMFEYYSTEVKPFVEIKVGNNWTLPLPYDEWINNDTHDVYKEGNIPANIAATYVIHRLYWAVNNDTLTISNNEITGNVDYGIINDSFWGVYSSKIKKVKIGGENDIIRPIDMINWFDKLYKINELDLTYLDTKSTISMKNTFSTGNCYLGDDASTCISSLTKIVGLENLDTSKVVDMSYAFSYNYSLKELNLTGWDTSNVEKMDSMFLSDAKLEKIKGIENFNTENVEDFTNIFSYCINLSELDLSSWNTLNATCTLYSNYSTNINPNISVNQLVRSSRSECNIFKNNLSLNRIKVGKNFNISLPNTTWINESTGTNYENGEVPLDTQSTYIKDGLIYWIIDDGTLILSDNYDDGFNSLNTKEYILNQKNWKEYSDIIENVEIVGIIRPYIMNEWFKDLNKVKKIDLSNVDISNLQSVYKLVNDMDNLEKINLTNFDLSGINKCIFIKYDGDSILPKADVIADKEYCVDLNYFCYYDEQSCRLFDLYCIGGSFECSQVLNDCNEGINEKSCTIYNDRCVGENSLADECDAMEMNYYLEYTVSFDEPDFESTCKNIERNRPACLYAMYYKDEYDSDYEFYNEFCNDYTVTSNTCTSVLNTCIVDDDYESCMLFNEYCDDFSYTASQCDKIGENLLGNSDYYLEEYTLPFFSNKCQNLDISQNTCDNILNLCQNGKSEACDFYVENCSEIGTTGVTCTFANYYNESEEFIEKYCLNTILTIEGCNIIEKQCVESSDESCRLYEDNCKFMDTNCSLFNENNKLKQISVDENNVGIVKESLIGPDNETGKWYDKDGNEYAVSELLNEDKTYYSTKPSIVSYNAEVDDQTKFVGEDLTLYDEIIKDSETSEIITKFDTVGGNDIDDVTSLKITTYSLKDFTDSDENTYLPGSKYTKDEDLELNVNYNSEDHYNEIELPIPVKHGYKFEYWTLDGERIDEYTPKTNKTLVAVWTEIKYHFVDDEVEYENESTDAVIFETVEGLEKFEELYINGKQLEKGEDYILDGNKIVLTEKGKEYLDSLESGVYEVKAEFSDSNSDVYGIIKVSEKENIPKEEPQDEPITPKTSDYILFTVIIALTALISSIFVYKKIEY